MREGEVKTEWVDLSQPLFVGMPCAAALGEVNLRVDRLLLEDPHETAVSEVCITHLQMAAHAGTHIDAARHMITDGRTIDQYPLERFLGPAVVLDVRREGAVPLTADELRLAEPTIRRGDMVLLYFGYAERFRDDSYYLHPYLSNEAADFLVSRGVSILGVDTLTPDLPGPRRPPGFDFPVHARLLGNDILIIENLGVGLKRILRKRTLVLAAPLRIEGGDASPVVPLAIR
jgi:kynurenine formamidase